MNEYKPRFKETVKEIGNVISSSFKYWVKLKWSGIKGFGKGIYYGMEMVYAIPTFIRQFKRQEKVEGGPPLDLNNGVEVIFGGFSGVSTYYSSVMGYTYLSLVEGHPEVLLIPAVTNAFSGLYEIARHRVKKRKSLEDKVE